MHTTRIATLLVMLALGLVACAAPGESSETAATAETAAEAAPPAEDTTPAMEALGPEAMAEMMRLAQPGPEHEELAKYAGEWEGEISIMMAPGTEPMIQTGAASCRMILDGRFLQMDSSGAFMGQPYEALGLMGFDRRNEVWTTVGFDQMGTYWVSGSGKRDDAGIIRMHGVDTEPLGEQVYFFELDFVSDDEFISSVWFSKQGPTVYDPPFKMVETRYTRK